MQYTCSYHDYLSTAYMVHIKFNNSSFFHYIAPGPIVGLKLLCSTFTTITLMWQKPIPSNGVILQYYISSIPFTSTTTQNIVAASQLLANTNYNFSVAACTIKGCGYPVFLQASTESIRECFVISILLAAYCCLIPQQISLVSVLLH